MNVPLLKKYTQLCVQLYNMDVGKDGLSGCNRITIKVAIFNVIKGDLGCFKIPFAEGMGAADFGQLLRNYDGGCKYQYLSVVLLLAILVILHFN